MIRILASVAFVIASNAAFCDSQWFGMYLKDKKVGYTEYRAEAPPDGNQVLHSVSVIDGKMLGFGLELKITSKSEYDKGVPKRMEFLTESGGKTQKVIAVFDADSIKASSEMDGRKTEKTLALPKRGLIVDDPIQWFLKHDGATNFYVFDPNTLELVECKPKVVGNEEVITALGKVQATVIDVNDPRAPMKVFVTSKGDLVRATGPFGLEIRPVEKEVALREGDAVDIALASAIKPNKPIDDYLRVSKLRLQFTGIDLSKLPSDDHQTVSKKGDDWVVDIHPVRPSGAVFDPDAATESKWLEKDIHIPSDSGKFVDLARTLTKDSKTVPEKAEAIRQFVNGRISANAGIGMLRDADDVLESGQGVCRDHAILMATLLRASKIPTRVVSGLVYGEGAFFYHAWVEIWTGKQWLALDSTRPTPAVDATHVKIAQGTVGEAFTSFLLDGAKVTVIDP